MFVIRDNSQRPGLVRRPCLNQKCNAFFGRVDQVKVHGIAGWQTVVTGMLVSALLCCFLLTAPRVAEAGDELTVPIKPLAQIKVDDDGRKLGYPTTVFYDPVEDEIYLINGGSNRVVVYGPDFFPRVSIGKGRGVTSPRGGEVLSDGEVYLCQVRGDKGSSYRITVLNGAFFVDREIHLDKIPEAKGFVPRQVAVSRDGIIYVAGDNYRGVLVLDNDGNYLRRLQPMDKISAYAAAEVEKQKQATKENEPTEKETQSSGEAVAKTSKDAEEGNSYADIPEEFRPRSSQPDKVASGEEVVGPVKVNFVSIDSNGRLYLISAETGKVYVYGPDESLLFSFGVKGGSPRQMSQPRGLAIDEKRGLIYVVDYMRHTILTYDMNGKFMFEIGGRGYAPGWFNFPSGIAINKQGQLIVADLFNKRVQVIEVEYDDVAYMFKGELPPGIKPDSDAGEEAKPKVEAEEPEAQPKSDLRSEVKVENGSEPVPEVKADAETGSGEDVKEVIIQDQKLPALPRDADSQEKAQESGTEAK